MPLQYSHIKALIHIRILLCLLILALSAGCFDKPGEGKLAQQGFAIADPIINALENYKNEHGKYPRALGELVPQYLEKDPQKDNAGEIHFIYFPAEEGSSYLLRLSYPSFFGSDDCSYTPAERKWRCGGTM